MKKLLRNARSMFMTMYYDCLDIMIFHPGLTLFVLIALFLLTMAATYQLGVNDGWLEAVEAAIAERR